MHNIRFTLVKAETCVFIKGELWELCDYELIN